MVLSVKDKIFYFLGFFGFIVVAPAVMYFISVQWPMTFLPEDASTYILGGLTSAVGLFFAIWSNYALIVKGKGAAGNFGNIKMMTETKHLVTTGPYGICRNPMHLGVFLYFMGLSCALNSLATLVMPLFIVVFAYCFAIFLDEPRLRKDFPEEFEEYCQNVPRFMPKILRWRS